MGKPKRKSRGLMIAVVFFLASVVFLYLFVNSVWMKRMMYPLDFTEHIEQFAAEYDLDPHLVASVIWVESRFRPEAVSRRDARGLMQVTPGTGQWGAEMIGIADFDDTQLFEPALNIRIGCWYLYTLSRQFKGNLQLILAAYNGGSGNVTKWLQNEEYSRDGQSLDYIPFRETREYVVKVMESYEIYKEIYPNLGISPNGKEQTNE